MKGYTPRPYYSLADVKRLAAAGNVFFARRRDGRSNPGQVGMTTREAHAVIAALVPRDFDLTSYDGPMPADVYKVPMPVALAYGYTLNYKLPRKATCLSSSASIHKKEELQP